MCIHVIALWGNFIFNPLRTFAQKQKLNFERTKNLKEKLTPAETIFAQKLEAIGVRYISQKGFIAGDYFCIVDFYLPRPIKVCVEIDGGYHNTENQRNRDARKDAYLRGRGFRVIRLTNREVSQITQEKIQALLVDHQYPEKETD